MTTHDRLLALLRKHFPLDRFSENDTEEQLLEVLDRAIQHDALTNRLTISKRAQQIVSIGTSAGISVDGHNLGPQDAVDFIRAGVEQMAHSLRGIYEVITGKPPEILSPAEVLTAVRAVVEQRDDLAGFAGACIANDSIRADVLGFIDDDVTAVLYDVLGQDWTDGSAEDPEPTHMWCGCPLDTRAEHRVGAHARALASGIDHMERWMPAVTGWCIISGLWRLDGGALLSQAMTWAAKVAMVTHTTIPAARAAIDAVIGLPGCADEQAAADRIVWKYSKMDGNLDEVVSALTGQPVECQRKE